MKHKSETYARDTVARMIQAGFAYVEAKRIRPYLENAYLAGYKAGRSSAFVQFEAEAAMENREVWAAIEGKTRITEDVVMQGRQNGSAICGEAPITEDIILKSAEQ